MTDLTKGGSFAQGHQEVALWLVRTAMAGLLAGLIWSVRILTGPGVDDPEWRRLGAEFNAARQESETTSLVRREGHRLRDRAMARADSVAGKDQQLAGILRLLQRDTIDTRVRYFLRRFPTRAAEDSAEAASLRALPLAPGVEGLVHAIETTHNRERRLWKILARSLAPENRSSRRARRDSVIEAWDQLFVAIGGALDMEGRVMVTDSVHFLRLKENLAQEKRLLQSATWKGRAAFVVFLVSSLALLALSAYAFTGDPNYLQPWRKRSTSGPTTPEPEVASTKAEPDKA